MFITFDMATSLHRLECLILPSYDQMSHNRQTKKESVFSHYRFPYQMDLDPDNPYDISNIGDSLLMA